MGDNSWGFLQAASRGHHGVVHGGEASHHSCFEMPWGFL